MKSFLSLIVVSVLVSILVSVSVSIQSDSGQRKQQNLESWIVGSNRTPITRWSSPKGQNEMVQMILHITNMVSTCNV